MAVTVPTKTNSVEVLAHAVATHPVTIVGASKAAVTKRSVAISMYHGYVEAVADDNPGKFKVQTRPDPGAGIVNEHWITVAEYPAKGTTPDVEVMTETEPVTEKVLAVASTTGFVAEDELYILDSTTLASSEWAECQEVVSNTSINILDGLTTEKAVGDTCVIYNDASKFVCGLDLEANESYRVIWSHEGATGANGHIKALAITHDSDTST